MIRRAVTACRPVVRRACTALVRAAALVVTMWAAYRLAPGLKPDWWGAHEHDALALTGSMYAIGWYFGSARELRRLRLELESIRIEAGA